MNAVDSVRLERIQRKMDEAGIDLLVVRLPEDVVYLTEYWPHHGVSVAVLARDGRPVLFLPEVEAEWADPSWADVEPFGWSMLKDPDLYDTYRSVLGKFAAQYGRATIGVEQSAEVVGPTYRSAEPIIPAAPWHAMVADVFADARLVDAVPFLAELRAIKTGYEVEKLRVAAEIAEIGLHHALENMTPGKTEAQIGALVEAKIRGEGPGYRGARLVRASAEVTAGLNSAKAVLLVPSTDYVTCEGDLVMIELGAVVDGYWSDLTYMGVLGEPTERQREVHNALLEAQLAAMAAVRPGALGSEPDRIARESLAKAGLDQYFPHVTGHGIGLRYHEFVPMLMPGSQVVLEPGMYMSVEPGVYIPGFGGVRIEDNVLVGPDGPVPLSTPRKPW